MHKLVWFRSVYSSTLLFSNWIELFPFQFSLPLSQVSTCSSLTKFNSHNWKLKFLISLTQFPWIIIIATVIWNHCFVWWETNRTNALLLGLMSGYSDEEISNGDRDGYQAGGSDGDDDDDDNAIGKKQHRRMGCGYGKRVVLHQFTKAKNQIRRIRSKRALLSSSSSCSTRNVSSRGKTVLHGGGGTRIGSGCRFCFSRPKVLETPIGSPTSDPNDPTFTQSMLKTLIEKSDFYSKECNPHIDY